MFAGSGLIALLLASGLEELAGNARRLPHALSLQVNEIRAAIRFDRPYSSGARFLVQYVAGVQRWSSSERGEGFRNMFITLICDGMPIGTHCF